MNSITMKSVMIYFFLFLFCVALSTVGLFYMAKCTFMDTYDVFVTSVDYRSEELAGGGKLWTGDVTISYGDNESTTFTIEKKLFKWQLPDPGDTMRVFYLRAGK